MSEENAYLVLGCFGRSEDGFILCPSVENRILKLDETLNKFPEMMEYFEAVHLFDRQMLDINAIRHLIFNIQDRYDQKIKRLWTEHQFNVLERFMLMHKACGLYAKLIVVPEELDVPKPKEAESVKIKGIPEEKRAELKLIRNRR